MVYLNRCGGIRYCLSSAKSNKITTRSKSIGMHNYYNKKKKIRQCASRSSLSFCRVVFRENYLHDSSTEQSNAATSVVRASPDCYVLLRWLLYYDNKKLRTTLRRASFKHRTAFQTPPNNTHQESSSLHHHLPWHHARSALCVLRKVLTLHMVVDWWPTNCSQPQTRCS